MAGLSCGIVGLPNVGKSTLFNALTSSGVPSANYPFCTIDPNVGVVEVIDPRLNILSSISHSHKIIYATTEFVDIAGLVEGASKGEGLGNAFLSHIRDVDAIAQVVRCFDSNDIIHVKGRIDPIDDVEIITLELILADLASCESSLSKIEKQAKTRKDLQPTVDVLIKVRDHLNDNKTLRTLPLSDEEKSLIASYRFLSMKPTLLVCNVSEEDLAKGTNQHVKRVEEYAKTHGLTTLVLCAKVEEEIAQLDASERALFLESLGLKESGLQRLVKSSFDMLGLITYLTTGEVETRAWTIHQGSTAWEAAGKIHTDIQKGFARAEVVAYDDFVRCNGRQGAKEVGKARAEGRDYIVQDGDVVLFLHSS